MGLTGKYDFKGIKSKGAAGLRLALAASPYTAWTLRFGGLTNLLLEAVANWLANNGLILLNIGAIYVGGELDQKLLDEAITRGLKEVEASGGKLSPERMKEIDDAVIRAADRALPYSTGK